MAITTGVFNKVFLMIFLCSPKVQKREHLDGAPLSALSFKQGDFFLRHKPVRIVLKVDARAILFAFVLALFVDRKRVYDL